MKKVGIIGLGWTGLPLAHYLKNEGWYVTGSTTSDEKKLQIEEEGIEVVRLKMNPHPEGNGFQKLFDCEYIVVNIPPRSRVQSSDFYLEQLKYLKSMINQSGSKKVVFVSSTGIYPNESHSSFYDESFELNHENSGNSTLWDSEQMLLKNREYQLSILRFGGLMGENRIPVKYFAGKENVTGHTRVNYLHLEDAIGSIAWILENEKWEEIFNVVAPIHPKRKEIYEKNSMDLGLEAPISYETEKVGADRLISSEKIIEFGYKFKQPDPLKFKYNSDKLLD
ncbi:epimerase [Algoriphagus sp.]|uniref:epimerase n=1 Tax=Algoriphagus sp. TaxID=1872435 RepID=UPI0025F26028|nr:epimerase [Algoriphagus sp.]